MSEQDDCHAGLRAGHTGSVFGPQSEAGRAGFNAGVGLARQQPGAGSPEWLLNGAAKTGAASAQNLPTMPAMTAMFRTPIQWLPVLLGVGAMQLFFMRAYSWRIYWNSRMMMWLLRPKGFEPFYFTWRKAKSDVVTKQAPIEMPRRRFME